MLYFAGNTLVIMIYRIPFSVVASPRKRVFKPAKILDPSSQG
jgi:hypothetical protein